MVISHTNKVTQNRNSENNHISSVTAKKQSSLKHPKGKVCVYQKSQRIDEEIFTKQTSI